MKVMDVPGLVRPEVRRLGIYGLETRPCRFKLDQNEMPWELPRRVRERVARRLAAASWATYPDFHSDSLRRALGRLHDHPWEGILVGNGSNELLGVALEAVTPPGGEVLGLVPGFGLYRMLVVRGGGVPRFLGPRGDLKLPLEELAAEVARDPRRPVILCTPNNPTGEAVPPQRVEALLERLEAPLLLDNAYGEFCRFDYRPLLARHPHLILFRTFSKAWSLAGLRLGYLLAAPELVAELVKLKAPYNVGWAGAIAGEAALEAAPALARRIRLVVARRWQWAQMLDVRGFCPLPSEANFILVRCPGEDAAGVFGGLVERDILVRDVSRGPGLTGCLRISVGSGPALRTTAAALDELQGERG